MSCRTFSCYLQFLFTGFFILLPVYAEESSKPCVFVPLSAENSCKDEDYEKNISDQLKNIVCPFPNLREAMADERMAQIIAGKNVFQTIESNDVIRLRKGVGMYVALNPLKKKLNRTYKDFYEIAQVDFTLNITTYPAEVQKGTCADHSTIVKKTLHEDEQEKLENLSEEGQGQKSTSETLGVKREISNIFGNYEVVEGKAPRHFELRKNQNGKIFICEAVKISLKERMNLYCSGDDVDDATDCEQQMPPLCAEWDAENSQHSKNTCASLSAFEKVSGEFFLNNMTMNQFCPDDCSYYIQLLQRVRKNEDRHCMESHAIVHCGPKKTEAKYNLNIKVVDDFCEDFKVMCVPMFVTPKKRLPPEKGGEKGVQESKL